MHVQRNIQINIIYLFVLQIDWLVKNKRKIDFVIFELIVLRFKK